jgi:hypothetical protein
MLASPLPIYLGCAGLIVGSLGLGAHHMLGGGSGPSTNKKDAAMEQPLFAKSVEQASLPTTQWPSKTKNVDVAYYGPMVELLTQPTASVPAPLADPSRVAAPQEATQGQQPPTRDVAPAPQSPSTTAHVQEQPRAAPRQEQPRDAVRELPPRQSKQSRRARDQRQRNEARASVEAASTEQVDPREARGQETRGQETRTQERHQERQRTATQVDTDRRDGRRSERRYRDRDDADEVDARSRADRRGREFEDRRQRDGERRVVVREEIREPAQRDVGFSPFRLFGIFDQR